MFCSWNRYVDILLRQQYWNLNFFNIVAMSHVCDLLNTRNSRCFQNPNSPKHLIYQPFLPRVLVSLLFASTVIPCPRHQWLVHLPYMSLKNDSNLNSFRVRSVIFSLILGTCIGNVSCYLQNHFPSGGLWTGPES